MSNMKQRLDLRQGQSLVMTPQLQLSLKLLQFSSIELVEFIDRELENNPMLERDDSQEQEPQEKSESENHDAEDSAKEDEAENSGDVDEVRDFPEEGNNIGNDGTSEEYQSDMMNMQTSGSGRTDFSEDDFSFEKILTDEVTLKEHLLDQINIDISDPKRRFAAVFLLDIIDENGYLPPDFSKTAMEALQCDENFLNELVLELQKLDPPGIFARSLAECLALQLKDRDHFDPAMEKLVMNLELLANGEMQKLQKICGVERDDLEDMIKEIKALNPKPGSNFSPEVVQTVQPDIFLRKSGGKFVLELNNATLPRLLVNNKYYSEVKKKAKNDAEKSYITEQYGNANWLVKSLNQRAETVLKVSTEIVSQQQEFFEKGIYYLKPLILRDIAEKVGVHESTVGRVTNSKYMATPRGLFELKFFFSSSVGNSSGEDDYSSKTVKYLIKELIDKEEDVLSDDALSAILKSRGVDVARRTVAKYREALKIPPSSRRKRMKLLRA